MTDTETPTVNSLISKMENEIGEVRRFGNALALAISGLGALDYMEDEDRAEALRTLAVEVCNATEKVSAQWKELFELSHSQV
jgi:hypothetical protein